MKNTQYELIIDDINPDQYKPVLQAGLRDFNYPFFDNYELKKFAIYIKNDTKVIIAGAYGFILKKHNAMRLEYFWVEKNHRNRGMGTQLIHKLEEYALSNYCKCIQLSTMDFQGTNFYNKMGYHLVATVPKWFCDHDELFFIKKLPMITAADSLP